MAYIQLNNPNPGIGGLLADRPDIRVPLMQVAELLMSGSSTLSGAEREMIAAYVSYLNDCRFCQNIHGATAACHLDKDAKSILDIIKSPATAQVSDKLKALFNIADKAQKNGKNVSENDIQTARRYGATDADIHDTVWITGFFCMINRCVDGLNTWSPQNIEDYLPVAKVMAEKGYRLEPEAYFTQG